MKKIVVLAILIFSNSLLFSQQKKVKLNWKGVKTIALDSKKYNVPAFTPEKNYAYSFETGLDYVEEWKITSPIQERTASLSNVVYSQISKSELKDLDLSKVSSQQRFSLKNSLARNKRFAVLSVSTILKEGTGYKKLESFTLNYNSGSSSAQNNSRRAIVNSVLSSGSWYKFTIDRSGVFRLSKQFLNDLGINTDGLDPRTIRIFGNGGNILPYANAIDVPIDPTENAIKVVGEEDGVFNDGDYVLFYGEGPNGFNQESNTNINLYTTKTNYYININGAQGKRIGAYVPPTGASTLAINTFQDYRYHEVDQFSIRMSQKFLSLIFQI